MPPHILVSKNTPWIHLPQHAHEVVVARVHRAQGRRREGRVCLGPVRAPAVGKEDAFEAGEETAVGNVEPVGSVVR
jgi:hypothetical protein